MPKCFICGTDQKVLTSKSGTTESYKLGCGVALCDKCLREAEKSGASK